MVLLSVGLLVQPVRAEPVNVSVDNTLANKYMFWGLKFGQNPILQSMVNVNRGNLTVTGFANTDLKTKDVDLGIIKFAKKNKNTIVATLDREIKSKTQNQKIVIRGKKRLEII